MNITTVGIHLTRTAFQLHAIDGTGMPVLRKKLDRSRVGEFFAALSPCLVGMVACGDANYWARRFQDMGHEVKLVGPHCIKPHTGADANEDRDDRAAEAICIALSDPTTRFVAIKPEEL